MNSGFNSALSAISAYTSRSKTTANNIANLNTPSYKAVSAIQQSTSGGGVAVTGTTTSQTQGSIITTGAGLDLAISGSGYFKVKTSGGEVGYTRNGSFATDSQGKLSDTNGNVVQPEITIPGNAENVSVDSQGKVTASVDGQTADLGQISLYTFNNPDGLRQGGDSTYYETADSGQPREGVAGAGGAGEVVSGSLELSNVDLATEMVALIENKNGFSAQAAVIRMTDETLGSMMDIKT